MLPLFIMQRLALFWFQLSFTCALWIPLLIALSLYYSSSLQYIGTVCALLAAYFYFVIIGPGRNDSAGGCNRWPMTLKDWSLWKHLAAYFPAKLVRTRPLEPHKQYLFVMQPHGLCAISGWINFATNATGFDHLFPGIKVHCSTLDANYNIPLLREYILLHGLCSSSKKALVNVLSSGPGESVLLAVGGASESLLSAPHTYDTLVGKRKGFVEVALLSGAPIVPVLAFGETNTFGTYIPKEGSVVKRMQKLLKKLSGFATPIFWGSNTFKGIGLMARQTPLTTVCGAPIDVPNPGTFSEKDRGTPLFIRQKDSIHSEYCNALMKLWDTHKDKYAPDRLREMQILRD